jgi:HTH-type transcriptional regulator/antitoxin HigA
MPTISKKRNRISEDYLALIQRFPLRPIRSTAELKQAHRIIDELSLIGEDDLTEGHLDYLLVLGDLTTAHEKQNLEDLTKGVTGLDVLKTLMDAHGLSASDIGRIIGQRELGAKVLNGSRQISKSHAAALGEHFGLPAEIFLR